MQSEWMSSLNKCTESSFLLNHSAHLFTWTTYDIIYTKFNISRVHGDLFAVQMFTSKSPAKVYRVKYFKKNLYVVKYFSFLTFVQRRISYNIFCTPLQFRTRHEWSVIPNLKVSFWTLVSWACDQKVGNKKKIIHDSREGFQGELIRKKL